MADYVDNRYEWDIEKSDAVYRRRGFDFHTAVEIFDNETYIDARIDDHDFGEERVIAIGMTRGLYITVVYTMRDKRKRIITAWRSASDEIDEYARQMGYKDE